MKVFLQLNVKYTLKLKSPQDYATAASATHSGCRSVFDHNIFNLVPKSSDRKNRCVKIGIKKNGLSFTCDYISGPHSRAFSLIN